MCNNLGFNNANIKQITELIYQSRHKQYDCSLSANFESAHLVLSYVQNAPF